MSRPLPHPGTVPGSSSVSSPCIEWLDEAGYDSAGVRARPDRLKIAVQDPNHVWRHLSSTFSRYQPFEGLQIKNKIGALQKVEDLYADVVQMQFKEAMMSAGTFGSIAARQRVATPNAAAASAANASRFGFATSDHAGSTSLPSSPAAIVAPPSFTTISPPGPSLKHPMHWHSYPYLHIFICTCINMEDYIKIVKPQIKRFMEYFVQPPAPPTPTTPAPAGSMPLSRGASTGGQVAPELRYHSEVFILYAPMLEEASITSASSFSTGGLSALFKRSSSFSSTPSPAALAEERAHQIKSARKVYERIRADFGGPTGAKDGGGQVSRIDLYYILQSQESAGHHESNLDLTHQWDEFVAKIVRSLIRTHEHRSSLYDYELKSSLVHSHLDGWNFCSFFVLKESFAQFHNQMGLQQDALRLYEELKRMMDDLIQRKDEDGHNGRKLQHLLDHTRAKTIRANSLVALLEGDPSAEQLEVIPIPTTSMPAPIMDVFSRDYPLLIFNGEISEIEWLRYLTARSMWILIKLGKNAANAATSNPSTTSVGGVTTPSSPNYLCEIMKRGESLIRTIIASIESQPDRYPIPFSEAFTWTLEACMDIGIICEKYLIQNYVSTYQSLTHKVLHQQQQAAAAAAAASTMSVPATRERGFTNVLASAVAAVIGPPTPTTNIAPPTPPTTASAATSTAGGSSAASAMNLTTTNVAHSSTSSQTLHQLTKSLKSTHESDLKQLQILRGDMYGWLLERILHFGRKDFNFQLKGEIRDVLEQERRMRLDRQRGTQHDSSNSSSTPSSSRMKMDSRVTPRASGSSSTTTATGGTTRIGLDEDVYQDMLQEYYPYEHKLNTHGRTSENNSSSTSAEIDSIDEDKSNTVATNTHTMSSSSNSKQMYALFQARHGRIISCFLSSSSPLPDAEEVTSSMPTFSDLFLELCTCCLRMYWLSGRYRLCTRVAEMKACVFYSIGEFRKSMDLFLTNAERWRKERWTQLYYPSYVMAIKAQQKLERYDEVVRSCLLFLITAHAHTASSRFRPPPLPNEPPEAFTWSRIGAIVKANKKEHNSTTYRDGAIRPIDADDDTNQHVPTSSQPFLPYTFSDITTPAAATSTSTHSSSSAHVNTSTTPAIIQIVQFDPDDVPAPAGSIDVPNSSVPPIASITSLSSTCPSFLLECCCQHLSPSSQPLSPSSDRMYDNGIVSPSDIQALLIHTLEVHLPSMTAASNTRYGEDISSLLTTFHQLRKMAHRPKPSVSLFTPHGEPASGRVGGVGSAPTKDTKKRHHATNTGTALTTTPIILHTPRATKVDVTDDATSAPSVSPSCDISLPPGSYIESTLHPFFLFRTAELFLYRKSHPFHAVLEVGIDSRFPNEICLDAITFVIDLKRHQVSTSEEDGHTYNTNRQQRRRQKQHKRISVVVPQTTIRRSQTEQVDSNRVENSSAPLSISVPPGSCSVSALPSPLPSQSLDTADMPTDTFDMQESVDPINADTAPSASPEMIATEAAVNEETNNAATLSEPSPSPETITIQQPPTTNTNEWICTFANVTLNTGKNKVYFHVFHAGRSSNDSTDHALPKVADDHLPSSSSTSSSPTRHYSVVLYHSFTDLDHLHAMFEHSQAHMQQVVERRRQQAIIAHSPITHSGAPRPFVQEETQTASTAATGLPSTSSSSLCASSIVHSYWSTAVRMADIWFGIGRLQLWHTDLTQFNRILKTRILTWKQRKKELLWKRDKFERGCHSQRLHADSNESISTSSDLVDIDLSLSPPPLASDPHARASFLPSAAQYKPFSGRPRLTIELLPIDPAALLIGKVAPVHIAMQITVHGSAAKGKRESNEDAPDAIERCVLHISTSASLKLFGASDQSDSRDANVTVSGLLLTHDGTRHRHSFPVDRQRGEVTIAVGRLSSRTKLILLLPIHSPGHLAHLIQTKQITLTNQPTQSSRVHTANQTPMNRSGMALPDGAMPDSSIDLHSVLHPFSVSLTCAPVLSAASALPSDVPPIPATCFLFTADHCLTFMEPIQLKATIERLGHRWFLQIFIGNRCAYPITIRQYRLQLPKGFILKRDPNEQAKSHVLPPLSSHCGVGVSHGAVSDAAGRLMFGSVAAAAATAIPVSLGHRSAPPNVYSMVFELGADESSAHTESDGDATMIRDEPDAEFTSMSASVGRFILDVDTGTNSNSIDSHPPTLTHTRTRTHSHSHSHSHTHSHSDRDSRIGVSSSLVSLSWPIDVAIMAGSHDLHLLLSLPTIAQMGRALTITITVVRISGKKKSPAAAASVSTRPDGDGNANDVIAPNDDSSHAPAPLVSTPSLSESESESDARPLSLLYTLIVPSSHSHWLIAGKHTAAFQLHPAEQKSFTIQILPLASGYLPIPHVEIQERVNAGPFGEGPPPAGRPSPSALHHRGGGTGTGTGLRVDTETETETDTGTSSSYAPIGHSHSHSGSHSDSVPVAFAYATVPPARMLRHFAPNQQIHVYPPKTCETHMHPVTI